MKMTLDKLRGTTDRFHVYLWGKEVTGVVEARSGFGYVTRYVREMGPTGQRVRIFFDEAAGNLRTYRTYGYVKIVRYPATTHIIVPGYNEKAGDAGCYK